MRARMPSRPVDAERAIAATRRWIEQAVIGLNLCPFARAVYTRERIRFVVSEARTADELLGDLQRELESLATVAADATETTVLIHPHALKRFADYNRFLGVADAALVALHLEGVLQIASFHPRYRFARTHADDVANNTNRSPYPTLHLLREASVAAATASVPDAASIYRRNIETMRQLGADGWAAFDFEGTRTASR
jgi:uncharacterized protein